jgi:hypothetical protein
MQKAEVSFFWSCQSNPIAAHRLQQLVSTHDVVLDKLTWSMNRPVDMRLGRKIHHRAWLVTGQQFGHQGCVANIALHEHMGRIIFQAGQVLQVAGIAEFVKINHGFPRLRKPVQHIVGSNKSGSAGYENGHGIFRP